MAKKVENITVEEKVIYEKYKIISKGYFILKDKVSGISRDNIIKPFETYIWNDNKLTGYGKTMYISFQDLRNNYDKEIVIIKL